jgi:hypothetical protein
MEGFAMKFSIIMSVDCPDEVPMSRYKPECVIPDGDDKAEYGLDQTEGDEQYEFSYLEGRWEKGTHRKWAGILTREQFDALVNQFGFCSERTPTGGSIGAPGFGYGWAPAISFNADDEDAIINMYVTPLPETIHSKREDFEGFSEDAWDRIKDAVIRHYAA